MAKKSKEIETTESVAPVIGSTAAPFDAEISPERAKKIRHFTNIAKKPYISKQGTFKPEIFEETLLKATESEVEEIFRWVFMEKPVNIESARARLITLVKDGN